MTYNRWHRYNIIDIIDIIWHSMTYDICTLSYDIDDIYDFYDIDDFYDILWHRWHLLSYDILWHLKIMMSRCQDRWMDNDGLLMRWDDNDLMIMMNDELLMMKLNA